MYLSLQFLVSKNMLKNYIKDTRKLRLWIRKLRNIDEKIQHAFETCPKKFSSLVESVKLPCHNAIFMDTYYYPFFLSFFLGFFFFFFFNAKQSFLFCYYVYQYLTINSECVNRAWKCTIVTHKASFYLHLVK